MERKRQQVFPSRQIRRGRGSIYESVRFPVFSPSTSPFTNTNRINYDPTNPLLYTNRTLTLLRLHLYASVIDDAQTSIRLLPENMKAYYHLAQAQIALHKSNEALASSKKAHTYCVEEIHRGGKGASSIGPITELVLRCKKEWWEEEEDRRLKGREGLLGTVVEALEEKGKSEEDRKVVDEVRRVFERAGAMDKEVRKRKVPDWCVDDITFAVMLDPVMVSSGVSLSGFEGEILTWNRRKRGNLMIGLQSWSI